MTTDERHPGGTSAPAMPPPFPGTPLPMPVPADAITTHSPADQPAGSSNGRVHAPPLSREELRREIDATRTDLADVLAALVRKSDVKARVGGELAHLRSRATTTARRNRTLLITIGGALIAAVAAGVVLWQQTRKGSR